MEQLVVERGEAARDDLKAHSSQEQLELYALGRLPESENTNLEEHLIVCAACRERLDGIGDFALAMRVAGAQVISPGWPQPGDRLHAWFRRPAVSMALAFALLLIVLGIFSTGRTKLAPVASLQLTAMRGAMPETIPARSYNLRLADAPRDGGPFRVEVLNPAGGKMWSGPAASGPSGVAVTVTQHLVQGDYFVRLISPDGTTLREYGFRVR
jgi:anti-sigma factor RsiW